jgi:hypothetical protein
MKVQVVFSWNRSVLIPRSIILIEYKIFFFGTMGAKHETENSFPLHPIYTLDNARWVMVYTDIYYLKVFRV